MESLRFGRHASASPATQVGLAALSQPGSHMGAEVILLDLNAISAREYHFRSLYTSVMLTFEHYPRRIFTRHALQPNRMRGFRGGVSLGLRDARSGLFALVRKEISCRVWKDAKS